jgi:hypothetical protein
MEGNSHGIMRGIILAFAWKGRGKPQENLSIACLRAEISTHYLLDMKWESC